MIKKSDIYKHYKGNRYKIIEIAKHSETLEDMVIYKALYGEGVVWVRSKTMFEENVLVDGVGTPRFEKIK